MTPQVVRDDVRRLSDMDLEGLRAAWKAHAGGPAPPLRSPELLRLLLAWRIQAQACGGLEAEVRRQLKRSGRVVAEGSELGSGSFLRREWDGAVVEVEIVDGGFRWNGQRFRSLSAAATAITGTKWNGPKFFGLRDAGP